MTLDLKAVFASIIAATAFGGLAHAAPLSVAVEGVEARSGNFFISVQTEAQFMKNDGIAGEMISTVEAGTLNRVFDLPAGRYAVSVWHDDDADGQFSSTPEGIPLDGWAMSGQELTSAPTFDMVAVTVPEEGTSVSLQMAYGR